MLTASTGSWVIPAQIEGSGCVSNASVFPKLLIVPGEIKTQPSACARSLKNIARVKPLRRMEFKHSIKTSFFRDQSIQETLGHFSRRIRVFDISCLHENYVKAGKWPLDRFYPRGWTVRSGPTEHEREEKRHGVTT